mgnify:CR=1 FL=1
MVNPKYINNDNYYIDVLLSKKYFNHFCNGYCMDVLVSIGYSNGIGQCYTDNFTCEYMKMNQFIIYYFCEKPKNLKIWRQ